MKNLPHKTVERLSQYRRILIHALKTGKTHIFSHEIAGMLHITPVQVRRDIMLVGYTGTLKKGYDVKGLIDLISELIDLEEGHKIALIGIGNLGRAIINYLSAESTAMSVAAAFDVNPDKVNKKFAGVPCYDIRKLGEIVKAENISIAVLTVPPDKAVGITDTLVNSGIKGILNFTSTSLNVPEDVYLEEYSIITSLEKVAFFVKYY
jgi:redox-sensing transcriptional repressor